MHGAVINACRPIFNSPRPRACHQKHTIEGPFGLAWNVFYVFLFKKKIIAICLVKTKGENVFFVATITGLISSPI
jgi:hypothetical protein